MNKRRLVVILLLVALCGGLIFFAFLGDAPVRASILASQGEDWRKSSEYQIMGKISRYGDWPQLMVFAAVFLGLSIWLKAKQWTRLIAAAMIASTLAGIFANASRLTTGRTRPRESPKIEQGFYGPWHDGKLTIGNSKFNAFPSGHTATAVGFAAPLLFAKPLVGVPVMLAALAIAWSRMSLGAHHLSDVVVSILLALLVGWFVLRWVRLHGDAAWYWLLHRWRILRQRRP